MAVDTSLKIVIQLTPFKNLHNWLFLAFEFQLATIKIVLKRQISELRACKFINLNK